MVSTLLDFIIKSVILLTVANPSENHGHRKDQTAERDGWISFINITYPH